MTHQHGVGVGTPIVSGGVVTTWTNRLANCNAISLTRYAQRVGYMECAFFGVIHPDNANYACRQLWTQAERDMIAWALAEAQQELEQEIGYHLAPCWTVNERHAYASIMRTRWGHVIAGGVKSDTMLDAGAAVDHSADPAVVTIASLGTCDVGDVHLFYPGTDIEIEPTSYATGNAGVMFSIPWCRMVAPAFQDTPEGLQYSDVATWITHTVDVRCISNDDTMQATLIYRTRPCECVAGCTDTRRAACIYVRDEVLGHVEIVATATPCTCAKPDWALLNYYSGLQTLTRQAEDAIIRLAHSKMPNEPCGCDVTTRLWARDREQGDVLTRERINCPFGTNAGAWFAYRQAQTMRLGKAGVL